MVRRGSFLNERCLDENGNRFEIGNIKDCCRIFNIKNNLEIDSKFNVWQENGIITCKTSWQIIGKRDCCLIQYVLLDVEENSGFNNMEDLYSFRHYCEIQEN